MAAAHRRVAHIGAADSPYTSERLADETLLHALLLRLDGVEVVGFDTDLEAAQLLSRALNTPFETIDVRAEMPTEHIKSYDLVLAGEVLEHVDDANRFLLGCKTLLTDDGVLCVTVPNACSPKVGLRALMRRWYIRITTRTTALGYFERHWIRPALGVFEMLTYLYLSPRGRLSGGLSLVLRGAHALCQGPVGKG